MTDDRDIPPDTGKRPRFAEAPDPAEAGAAGSGPGYSGQEYDNAGQRAWRERQRGGDVAPGGAVHGSGVGAGGGSRGEDYDNDSATGDGDPAPGGKGGEHAVRTTPQR